VENITKGHWVFAAIFAITFLIYLVWSYKKDFKLNKIYYSGSSYFILVVIVLMFLLYIFRGTLN